MLTKNNICDKMGISFLRREIMVKRIVSSALALVLLATSLVFLGVAIINIIEPIIEILAVLIENKFSYFWQHVYQYLYINGYYIRLINPMKLGVPAKLIISGLLFAFAIFVVSYKDSKVWSIIRKVSGIATSVFLLLFALSRVLFFLSRSLTWLLIFVRLFANFKYFFVDFYDSLTIKVFGSLSFAIFLSLVVAVICVVLAVYVLVCSFKKKQVSVDKSKTETKKKLKTEEKAEEKTEAKTETKVELDPNGAIIVKFN